MNKKDRERLQKNSKPCGAPFFFFCMLLWRFSATLGFFVSIAREAREP